ncbi:leishmanolysin [Trypanosoma rangeli]|uniref:Leishmanolysin-like peptidase n=1 Tax=Trypanosoma rangeli TaxID=5698 RepID=A0A3R7KJI4_TRYRA|nr:leishmanolysin [Trypanosoma rangeli]RNE95726.1 leishmanolysin [Trypanosoma rangeli]|eukprot:RNE95726.1 leishmanolysin [Trypanosoma rangeli]
MHHTPYILLLLLLLLCCFTASFAAAEHRCIFDRISRKAGPPMRAVVRELPGRERDGTQVFAAFVSDWAPIRFKVFSRDMNSASRYCTAAGESRPDMGGRIRVCRRNDVLTAKKKSIILSRLLPRATQLHMDRLHVQPFTGAVVVQNFSAGTVLRQF